MDTNFTLISQLFQMIEHFTFLPLEAAVHQFSTYLHLISVFFFQSVCNHEGYLPKLLKSM